MQGSRVFTCPGGCANGERARPCPALPALALLANPTHAADTSSEQRPAQLPPLAPFTTAHL